jgi:hypothetical protein
MDCETLDDRTAIADYISDLTAELALLAAWAEHTDLARILEMARLESEQICGRSENTAEEPALDDEACGIAADMTDDVANELAAAGDVEADPFGATNVIRLPTLRAAQR